MEIHVGMEALADMIQQQVMVFIGLLVSVLYDDD